MQKLQFLFYLACCYSLSCCTPAYSPKAAIPISPALPTTPSSTEDHALTPLTIDYSSFRQLTQNIDPYRQQRLIDIEDFAKMMAEADVMVLDTRSKSAYDDIHIQGAVHLNFSDFTVDKLARVIPSKKTRILIYCNNNFLDGGASLAGKAPPLALNIPTFINLVGYGYEDVYELKTVLSLVAAKECLEFEGSSLLLQQSSVITPSNN